jgi:hypothetical protein
MNKNNLIILLVVLFLSNKSPAQDTLSGSDVFPAGISMNYGMGSYSHKDEYISEEKYSGWLPYFSFGWARVHERYVYRLEMAYRESSEIKNHNARADITQFTLNQGFIYPLRARTMFKRDLFLWIGPSSDVYFFYNKPKIAVSGFDYAQSFALLMSLGLNAEGIYPVKPHLQLESSIRLTILSIGGRMVDNEEDGQSPARLLTSLSGLYSSFDLGVRYYLFNRFSVKLAYRFELTRISKWMPLLSASDNLIFGMTYKF